MEKTEAVAVSSGVALRDLLTIPVIVASLGYFVDIYDLILFSIVRIPSLRAIGLQGKELLDQGVFLLNMQMGGMLIGGILWGILGDRKGRLKILFGSIFIYSAANIANGFVGSVAGYAAWRFVAGVGLAGELGAGITLVLENLPRSSRGYGTMIVASVGVTGAILANFVANHFDWRAAYFIGGGLGLLLLLMRIGAFESGMYKEIERMEVSKGDFISLFTQRRRFFKYLKSILIGLPIWFAVGILITFSPEFARSLGVTGQINAGEAVMSCYLGLVFGDFVSGFLSQYFGSRKRIVLLFQFLTLAAVGAYFMRRGVSPALFYLHCGIIGFAVGYWAIFVTIAAEQFGTNLRATVASTVPNFIRGTVIPITFAFQFLRGRVGIVHSAAIVGAVCLAISFCALNGLEETFDKDLDYIEE
jgi:putative MFS transporter